MKVTDILCFAENIVTIQRLYEEGREQAEHTLKRGRVSKAKFVMEHDTELISKANWKNVKESPTRRTNHRRNGLNSKIRELKARADAFSLNDLPLEIIEEEEVEEIIEKTKETYSNLKSPDSGVIPHTYMSKASGHTVEIEAERHFYDRKNPIILDANGERFTCRTLPDDLRFKNITKILVYRSRLEVNAKIVEKALHEELGLQHQHLWQGYGYGGMTSQDLGKTGIYEVWLFVYPAVLTLLERGQIRLNPECSLMTHPDTPGPFPGTVEELKKGMTNVCRRASNPVWREYLRTIARAGVTPSMPSLDGLSLLPPNAETEARKTQNNGYFHREKSKQRIGDANKGKVPHNKGMKRKSEDKKKISNGLKRSNELEVRLGLLATETNIPLEEYSTTFSAKGLKPLRNLIARRKKNNTPVSELEEEVGRRVARREHILNTGKIVYMKLKSKPSPSLSLALSVIEDPPTQKTLRLVDEVWNVESIEEQVERIEEQGTSSLEDEEPVLETDILKAEETARVKSWMNLPPPPPATGNKKLTGMVFVITGKLTVKREDFTQILENNGGIVKSSMAKDVTHLIATRKDTGNYAKAIARGVEILSESQVLEKIGSSNEGVGNDYHDGKAEVGRSSPNHGLPLLSAAANVLVCKILKPTHRGCNVDSQEERSTFASKVEEPVLVEGGSSATGKENAVGSFAVKNSTGIEDEAESPTLDMRKPPKANQRLGASML